MYVGIRRCIYF